MSYWGLLQKEVRGEATSGTRLSEAAALTWQLVGHGAIIATMHDVPAGDAARGTHHACEATGCMHATLTHSPSGLPARGPAGRRPVETLKVAAYELELLDVLSSPAAGEPVFILLFLPDVRCILSSKAKSARLVKPVTPSVTEARMWLQG